MPNLRFRPTRTPLFSVTTSSGNFDRDVRVYTSRSQRNPTRLVDGCAIATMLHRRFATRHGVVRINARGVRPRKVRLAACDAFCNALRECTAGRASVSQTVYFKPSAFESEDSHACGRFCRKRFYPKNRFCVIEARDTSKLDYLPRQLWCCLRNYK